MSPDYPTGSLRLVHSTSVAVLRACASPSRRAGGPGKERERDREREEFGERVDEDSLSAEREFMSSFTPLTPHCPPPRTPSATPAARVTRVPSKGSRGAKEGARVKTISLDSVNDTRIQEALGAQLEHTLLGLASGHGRQEPPGCLGVEDEGIRGVPEAMTALALACVKLGNMEKLS